MLRGLLIFPVAFGLAAQSGFAAKPAMPKDCCSSSCPTGKPDKQIPDCCKISAAPDQAAAIAAAPVAPVLCALLPVFAMLPNPPAVHAVVSSEVRPPPGRDRLSPSGLSPPRLA